MLTSQNIDDTVAVLKASLPSGTPLLLLSASTLQCAQLYGPSIYGSVFSPLQSQLASSGKPTMTSSSSSPQDGNVNVDETQDTNPTHHVIYISFPVTDYSRGNGGSGRVGGPVDSGHWSLCLLRLRWYIERDASTTSEGDAFCFDSLGERNNEFVRPAIVSVLAGLELYWKTLSSSPNTAEQQQLPSVDKVPIIKSPSDFPRQYSSTGCGLYVCAVMEVLVGRCHNHTLGRNISNDTVLAHVPSDPMRLLDLVATPVDILSLVPKPFEESYRERLFAQVLHKNT